jgi:hypothetical protein
MGIGTNGSVLMMRLSAVMGRPEAPENDNRIWGGRSKSPS